jgi:hypothetical protein
VLRDAFIARRRDIQEEMDEPQRRPRWDTFEWIRSYIGSRIMVAKTRERTKLIKYKKVALFKMNNPGEVLPKKMNKDYNDLLDTLASIQDDDEYDSDELW